MEDFPSALACYVWERLTVFQIKEGPCCMVLGDSHSRHYGSFAQDFHAIWAFVLMAVNWHQDRAKLRPVSLLVSLWGLSVLKNLSIIQGNCYLSCGLAVSLLDSLSLFQGEKLKCGWIAWNSDNAYLCDTRCSLNWQFCIPYSKEHIRSRFSRALFLLCFLPRLFWC